MCRKKIKLWGVAGAKGVKMTHVCLSFRNRNPLFGVS